MLATLQHLPWDAEVLAFEAGCEEYCEREVDEAEWQGGRVYLHLWVPDAMSRPGGSRPVPWRRSTRRGGPAAAASRVPLRRDLRGRLRL